MHRTILALLAASLLLSACSSTQPAEVDKPASGQRRVIRPIHKGKGIPTPPPPLEQIPEVGTKSDKTDADWRELLTPAQYSIFREKDTEMAFTGVYNTYKADGVFHCAACNAPLFDTDTKFESGSGWPSFYAPVDPRRVTLVEDSSHGMERIEVLCAHCNGHLGHVFDDGPKPTGQRYCINSQTLYLHEDQQSSSTPAPAPAP
jgi:peptide-methionine (R)-S-oxide reductase